MSNADRMRDVDVQRGVMSQPSLRACLIFRLCRARRKPEVRPVRLKYSRTRTDNIGAAELLFRDVEHVVQVRPLNDVSFDEDRTSFAIVLRRVFVDELLSFRTEGQVGDYDITVASKEKLRECEIDAWVLMSVGTLRSKIYYPNSYLIRLL